MIGRQRDFSTWVVGLLSLGVAVFIGYKIPHEQIPLMPVSTPTPQSKPPAIKESDIKTAFQPPSEDKIPGNEFGQMVKLGADIFHDTQRNAKEFVGNSLQCANCHIDRGRLANSAPLWAAYVAFPTYRANPQNRSACLKRARNGLVRRVRHSLGRDALRAVARPFKQMFWLRPPRSVRRGPVDRSEMISLQYLCAAFADDDTRRHCIAG